MPCSLQHAGGRRGIANYAQNGLARDRTLPEHHLGGCAARQEHVHPAPEADQADTLPGHHDIRSEEHTSELQSLMRISYAVFCLKKKNTPHNKTSTHTENM